MPREEALAFSLSGIRFLGENLLGTGALKNELSTFDSSLKRVVRATKPQMFCNKQSVEGPDYMANFSPGSTRLISGKHNFKYFGKLEN